MTNRPIANSWNGIYTYDPIPELSDLLVDTPFYLSIIVGWFGRFKGAITDHPPGIPEPAAIAGRILGDTIHFTKKYPSLWIVNENGKLTNLPSERSHVLHYEGRIDHGPPRISGTWKVFAERRTINGLEIHFPPASGKWTATPAS